MHTAQPVSLSLPQREGRPRVQAPPSAVASSNSASYNRTGVCVCATVWVCGGVVHFGVCVTVYFTEVRCEIANVSHGNFRLSQYVGTGDPFARVVARAIWMLRTNRCALLIYTE
eukprot:m.1648054 g.1648054  ORF g.1648054 m.1648054 type:complete len:114 (+) comp77626_c0_seq1:52-393(+)